MRCVDGQQLDQSQNDWDEIESQRYWRAVEVHRADARGDEAPPADRRSAQRWRLFCPKRFARALWSGQSDQSGFTRDSLAKRHGGYLQGPRRESVALRERGRGHNQESSAWEVRLPGAAF